MQRRFLWVNAVCLAIGLFFAVVTWKYWRRSTPAMMPAEVASIPVVASEPLVREQEPVNSDQVFKNQESGLPGEALAKTGIRHPVPTSTLVRAPDTSSPSIPNKINLAVPFTSQAPEKNWDQPWQDACEEAAVLMLDAFYKGYGVSPLFAKDEMLKMVNWEEHEKGWGRSITIEQVKELFDWYAFGTENTENTESTKTQKARKQSRIIENPTIEDIKKFVANRQPVLVVADGKALPNPYFRNGGPEYHALIIRGYTEDKFITNDPGTWRGENFTYKYDDLMNAIRDWNGGKVKEGRRVVLVVE